MPATVISVDVVRVDNSILLDYLTSKVVLEEPEIGTSDSNIQINNNCMDDELHFGMLGGRVDYEDENYESDERDAIPTASPRQWAATKLESLDLATSDVDGYEGDDGDDADEDEEEEASLADDGSTHNVEDCGHSTRECEDWTWR